MKDNIIRNKSYAFALKVVGLYRKLVLDKKEHVLSKQMLRSGTSIGANVEEAVGGQSRKDFTAKLSIAYKEARETHYWLRILFDSEYINKSEFEALICDCEEILKIIGSIQKTIRKNS